MEISGIANLDRGKTTGLVFGFRIVGTHVQDYSTLLYTPAEILCSQSISFLHAQSKQSFGFPSADYCNCGH